MIATVFGLAKQATEIKKPAPVAELTSLARRRRRSTRPPSKSGPRAADGAGENEFHLTYQPIINLHGEPAEMFEVPLRPHRPKQRGHRTRPVHAGGGSRGTHAGD